MTLSTAQMVRLRIQDQPKLFDEVRVFDGTAQVFTLPWLNITSASAYVTASGGAAWTGTGATFASGQVQFSAVGSAGAPFRVAGVYSTFSDDEIGHFTAVGGSINGAALEAVQTLMFDGLKRARWMAPDGSQYDDTAAMGLLKTLHDTLSSALEAQEVAGGGWVSWSEGQADL